MTVLVHTDWQYGTLAADVYTQATPEIPNAFAWNFFGSKVVESASPWNGQTLANFTAQPWHAADNTLTSATMQATSGRILVELEPPSGTADINFVKFESATVTDKCYVQRVTGNLKVYGSRNFAAGEGTVDLGAFPTGANRIELIYDFNNGTAADRVKARVWEKGGSPGGFTTCSWAGTSGTTAQWVLGAIAGQNRYGYVTISDDTTQDLSTWSPGGGSVPPNMRYRPERNTLLRM